MPDARKWPLKFVASKLTAPGAPLRAGTMRKVESALSRSLWMSVICDGEQGWQYALWGL
jgi:hypothetical protein